MASASCANVLDPPAAFDLHSEATWNELYPLLRLLAKRLVRTFDVSAWQGQEDDIVEDIVQETAERILERTRLAQLGVATPIDSPRKMMLTIVWNYCRDLRRKDRRLVRILPCDWSPDAFLLLSEQAECSEDATDKVYQEMLFSALASEIAHFPAKQRRALLIDLANRMYFDCQPTPLQAAFLEVGIRLEEYRVPLPVNPAERFRHRSLLSLAYKRIARLTCVQEYVPVA
jgi:DNA-directed RNA polymerase specialized sigma24 family protein